jgi:SAM-dependent methyltransferase
MVRPDPKVAIQRRIADEFDRAAGLPQPGFPARLQLPPEYGKGLPERVVELLIARLSYRAGLSVLDVGHAYATRAHLHMLRSLPEPRHLTGIDIAPPSYDTTPYYQRSISADIIASGIADDNFDLIWCISALEHFGMDNSMYTARFNQAAGQDARALGEMVRILAPAGTLVVTVPYGRYEDHRTMKNYDAQRWQALLETIRSKARIREMYFRHTFGAGWAQAECQELRYVGYYDQANAGAGAIAIAHITKADDSDGRPR